MNLAGLPDRRAKQDPYGPSVADDDNDLNNNEFLEAVQRAAAGQYWDLKEPAKSRGPEIAADERRQAGPSNLASADSEVSPAELRDWDY